MKIHTSALVATLCAISLGALTARAASPYVGQDTREIKSMSTDDITAYLSGKGMGLAKAAELNGYAGPAHVLELASPLELTPEQRSQTAALFTSMRLRASSLGQALVEQEIQLDQLFVTRTITPESLNRSLNAIAALQAKIRAVHLGAHLVQVEILTVEQNARYAHLRGYANADSHGGNAGAHIH